MTTAAQPQALSARQWRGLGSLDRQRPIAERCGRLRQAPGPSASASGSPKAGLPGLGTRGRSLFTLPARRCNPAQLPKRKCACFVFDANDGVGLLAAKRGSAELRLSQRGKLLFNLRELVAVLGDYAKNHGDLLLPHLAEFVGEGINRFLLAGQGTRGGAELFGEQPDRDFKNFRASFDFLGLGKRHPNLLAVLKFHEKRLLGATDDGVRDESGGGHVTLRDVWGASPRQDQFRANGPSVKGKFQFIFQVLK